VILRRRRRDERPLPLVIDHRHAESGVASLVSVNGLAHVVLLRDDSRSKKRTATSVPLDSRTPVGGSAHGVVAPPVVINAPSRGRRRRFREFCDAQHDIDHDRVETEETRDALTRSPNECRGRHRRYVNHCLLRHARPPTIDESHATSRKSAVSEISEVLGTVAPCVTN